MSAKTITSALNAHLAAMPDAPRIAWPNAPFDPPSGIYIRVDGLPRETDAPFLGDDSALDYGGIYQITVMSPLGANTHDALDVVDQITDHFQRGDIGSNVRIRKTSVAPALESGNRWAIPVSVYYRAILSPA